MDKRKLSKVPIETATNDMQDIAQRLNEKYIVTVSLIEDNKILLMHFYEIATLREGKTQAAFRTFMSKSDYITQDLTASKIKWKTASFENMNNCCLWDVSWNKEKKIWNIQVKYLYILHRIRTRLKNFLKSIIRSQKYQSHGAVCADFRNMLCQND